MAPGEGLSRRRDVIYCQGAGLEMPGWRRGRRNPTLEPGFRRPGSQVMREVIMRLIMACAFIAALAMGYHAHAQGTTPSNPSNSPALGTTPNAPVGHRQPRQNDLPPPDSAGTDPASTGSAVNPPRPDPNDADARLNRALKNICRGC
ncbi:MAG TPA: hypothetical protein VKE26_04760 [Xanthobacteraceae bacterium]|nr:hypothetical protein [Xanthobacteraceae bacterium]